MTIFTVIIILVAINNSVAGNERPADFREKFQATVPACPNSHTDSIIPIVYGLPTKEAFQQADSGLIYLGGCDMNSASPKWYCTKHRLTF